MVTPLYIGTWLSEHNHNYYPNFRKQYRYPYQKRLLEEELPMMKALEEEERPTYFQRISKEMVCWGYQCFIGFILFMDLMFSGTQSLMLCTCYLSMWSRITLSDGFLKTILPKKTLTPTWQKCHGPQVQYM